MSRATAAISAPLTRAPALRPLHCPRRAKAVEKLSVHVANLTPNVNEAHLRHMFGFFGHVTNAEVELDPIHKLPKVRVAAIPAARVSGASDARLRRQGIAYVDFKTAEQAQAAADHMNEVRQRGWRHRGRRPPATFARRPTWTAPPSASTSPL